MEQAAQPSYFSIECRLRVKTRSALIEHTVSGFAPKTDVPMRASGVEIGHRDVILACKNGGQDHTL